VEYEKLNRSQLDYLDKLFTELKITNESQREFYNLKDFKAHSIRVARLVQKAGNKLGLSHEQHHSLKKAALFHDIGKLKFSEHLFFKKDIVTTQPLTKTDL